MPMPDYSFQPAQEDSPCKEAFMRVVNAVAKERAAAEDKLTEQQFIEALRQALACGDFVRHICVDNGSQCVTYMPFRNEETSRARIEELERQLSEACRIADIAPDVLQDDARYATSR